MKIAVKYKISKWSMTETYELKHLKFLIRHLTSDAREVLSACVIVGGKVITIV